METFKVGELKKNFSEILKKVQSGQKILISFGKKDEKIAVIVPYKSYVKKKNRPLGLLEGKASFKMSDKFLMTDEEFLSS